MKIIILTISLVSIGFLANAQVVTSSRHNPIQETPDTTQITNGNPNAGGGNQSEINSGSKKITVTPVQGEATKNEEKSTEPVNNTGAKNPK